MPRRRSGLNDRSPNTALLLGPIGAVVLVVAGCQEGQTDNGCQITRQLVMPGTTPLPLLTNVRIDRVRSGYAIFGHDDTAVRWAMIDALGTIGAEQSYPLPAGTLRPLYAAAGASTPGDTVVIGLLVTTAHRPDAELRFVAAPADGSSAPALGPPVTTFGGGADPLVPPQIAVGPSASGMYAGAAWLDYQTGFPTYAFIDGLGDVVGATHTIDTTP